jgi:hypothetical protein
LIVATESKPGKRQTEGRSDRLLNHHLDRATPSLTPNLAAESAHNRHNPKADVVVTIVRGVVVAIG